MNLFNILDDIEYVGDNFCDTYEVLSVLRMIGYIIFLLKMAVPIIIIIVESLKFYNAIKDGTSDSFSKHLKSLIIRCVIGFLIFFLPTIIHALLDIFIDPEAKNCEVCILKPFSCDPKNPSIINANGDPHNNTTTPELDGATKCLTKCAAYITIPGNKYDKCMDECLSENNTDNTYQDPKCSERTSDVCENYTGCKWNNTIWKCEYKETEENCEFSCNSKYTSGSKSHLDCLDKCSDKNAYKTCEEIGYSKCNDYTAKCKRITENGLPKCVDKDYVSEDADLIGDYCASIDTSKCESFSNGICKLENGKCVQNDSPNSKPVLDPIDTMCKSKKENECTGVCEWNNGTCQAKNSGDDIIITN